MAARFAARVAMSRQTEVDDDLESHFVELSAEAEPLITEETGFAVPSSAIARVLTRAEWASANVDSMLTMIGPMIRKLDKRIVRTPVSGLVRLAYRPALGAQLGMVLGFLSQRVLGQYDTLVEHGDQVWFVGSNIVNMERKLRFVPRDFRLWIVLHELTHRAQFTGNPWLRDHFRTGVNELLDSMDLDARGLTARLRAVFTDRGAPFGVRLLTPAQREAFDRMQAFMSVIEGHGNFVMDRIAERIIPTQPQMRRVLRGQGGAGGPISKLIGKLLGLEMKRAQYEQGQAFFDRIFEVGGQAKVRYCFTGPDALPSLQEIRNPDLWIARTPA